MLELHNADKGENEVPLLIFYLYLTNYLTLDCLNHTHLCSHSFCGLEFQAWLNLVLTSRSYQATMKSVSWTVFLSEGPTGEASTSKFTHGVAEFISL